MTAAVLAISHLLVALASSALTYCVVTRRLEARQLRDGHTVLEIHHPSEEETVPRDTPRTPTWFSVLALAVGILLVIGGAQLWLTQRDRAARAAEDRERAAQDRTYAQCLTHWSADLVMTLQKRTDANNDLTRAEKERADALDYIVTITSRARQVPPRATEADFDRAIAREIKARRNLEAVQRETDKVRARNQYVLPQAVCKR